MKKAKIYKPSKTATQSGLKKFDKWIIEFITKNPGINPLMGWESSSDTYSELNLEFKSNKNKGINPLMGWERSDNTLSELNLEFITKESAIKYAKKNKIELDNDIN